MLTKAEEMAILDVAIRKLGKDSYVGPWLESVRDEVGQLMQSDIEPSGHLNTLAETQEKCRQMINDTKAEAMTILDVAEKIILEADDRVESIRRSAEKALSDALHKLQS